MDSIITVGQMAPPFTLPDLEGALHTLEAQRGRVVILNFWSAECPWSARADADLLALTGDWGPRVTLWTIAANANETETQIRAAAAERGLPGLLRDAHQQVADLYAAQTTPHLFVIDPEGILRYQGALDDVTFRRRTPTVNYVRQAVEALLVGRQPDPDQTPPYGCTIVRAFET